MADYIPAFCLFFTLIGYWLGRRSVTIHGDVNGRIEQHGGWLRVVGNVTNHGDPYPAVRSFHGDIEVNGDIIAK